MLISALLGAALASAGCLLQRHLSDRHAAGNVPPPRELTAWDERSMAYHEAGHAVCSYFLPEREQLLRVTISPTDEAFGMVQVAPRPHHNETRVSLMSTLAVLTAGRLAEELFLNEVTTSGIHDLGAAGQLAADMVLKFGMGEKTKTALLPPEMPLDDALLQMINSDIRRLLISADEKAHQVLTERSEVVEALVELLLREKTLGEKQLRTFFDRVA